MTLYGLLLAGGKSSRMGRDKSTLVYNGKTLGEHALALLGECGVDKVLVSGSIPGYPGVRDLIPGCGPLGGIHAVLHYLDEQGLLDGSPLLVIPVDMPLLDIQTLDILVSATGHADSCHFEGEVFPCVLKASRRLKTALDDLFAESTELGGARSMKALLRMGEELVLPVAGLPIDVFKNLNNPEDWERFRLGLE